MNTPLNSGAGGGNLTPRQERLLLDYLDALERGDLARLEEILEKENSPKFEEAVWDAQVALGEAALKADMEAQAAGTVAEEERLRALIADALRRPTARTRAQIEQEQRLREEADAMEADPPPLTLRDVAARLRENIAAGLVVARNRADARTVVARIESAPAEPLTDEHLSTRGMRTLLQRLGLGPAGTWLEKLFHDAVIDLTQQREQELFRLAAARRRQPRRPSPPSLSPPQAEGVNDQTDERIDEEDAK